MGTLKSCVGVTVLGVKNDDLWEIVSNGAAASVHSSATSEDMTDELKEFFASACNELYLRLALE